MTSLTITIKEQGKPVRHVTFKGDNPDLLMKPPCTTKVYDREAPPKATNGHQNIRFAVALPI